jgi:hypothetical protein
MRSIGAALIMSILGWTRHLLVLTIVVVVGFVIHPESLAGCCIWTIADEFLLPPNGDSASSFPKSHDPNLRWIVLGVVDSTAYRPSEGGSAGTDEPLMAMVRPLRTICGEAPEAPFWTLTGTGRVANGTYYFASGFIGVGVGDTVIQAKSGDWPLELSCTAAPVVHGMLGQLQVDDAIARCQGRHGNQGCR